LLFFQNGAAKQNVWILGLQKFALTLKKTYLGTSEGKRFGFLPFHFFYKIHEISYDAK
jgi:hypothetical protein